MSDATNREAVAGRIEIGTSRLQVIALAVMIATMIGGLSFCANTGRPSVTLMSPWPIFGVVFLVAACVLAPSFLNTSPRIILDETTISWRDSLHKIYQALSWTEIVSASIEPGGEDEVRRLRLFLPPRPALESVASEGARRWVDISIDAIDLHERRLRRLINERAPHLFPGAARRAIDLTAS